MPAAWCRIRQRPQARQNTSVRMRPGQCLQAARAAAPIRLATLAIFNSTPLALSRPRPTCTGTTLTIAWGLTAHHRLTHSRLLAIAVSREPIASERRRSRQASSVAAANGDYTFSQIGGMAAKGDLVVRDSSGPTILSVGAAADGQVLTLDST